MYFNLGRSRFERETLKQQSWVRDWLYTIYLISIKQKGKKTFYGMIKINTGMIKVTVFGNVDSSMKSELNVAHKIFQENYSDSF